MNSKTLSDFVEATRAVTVGVGLKAEENIYDIKMSLVELDQLVESIGAEVVGSVVQRVSQWTPATLIGSGKIEEIKSLAEDSHATFIVIDHHLSGAQVRNLSENLGKPVIDRTQLIIEIFARRAQSHEGKLQVELAQSLDQYSRQVGAWHGSLSRQGGGIGTRGLGEKAIELDRRTIRNRIAKIRRELEVTRQHRSQHRASRRRHNIPTFALIGYTNAGKSTLLSQLTHTETFVADQVFATLDPLTRKIFLPDFPNVVMTDTVGFIRKLPTQLVEAFKATLEETDEADFLLHVIDLSSPEWQTQVDIVNTLIKELHWEEKPVLHVFNKCDIAPHERKFKVNATPRVFISAANKEGLDELKSELSRMLEQMTNSVELFFDHSSSHQVFNLARECKILKQEEGTTGVVCIALMTTNQRSKWSPYIV